MNAWFVQASAEECSLHQITINAELGSAHGFGASTDRGEVHTQSCIDFWQGDRSTHGFGFGSEKRGQVCTSMLKRFQKRGQVHTKFQTKLKKGTGLHMMLSRHQKRGQVHTWSSWSPARLVRWRVIVTLLGCCWHQVKEKRTVLPLVPLATSDTLSGLYNVVSPTFVGALHYVELTSSRYR